MRWRRRGRSAVLAVALLAVLASAAAAGVFGASRPTLLVSLPDGRTVARLSLPESGEVTLRYRNSLYGTLAAERFVVTGDGRLRLVGLEAEQLAVLEEYYAVNLVSTRQGGALTYAGPPSHTPVIRSLRIAATDRGERTLLVAGHDQVDLWRLVDDDSPTVILEVTR